MSKSVVRVSGSGSASRLSPGLGTLKVAANSSACLLGGAPRVRIRAGNRLKSYRTARSAFPAVVLDPVGPDRESGKTALEWRDSRSRYCLFSEDPRSPPRAGHERASDSATTVAPPQRTFSPHKQRGGGCTFSLANHARSPGESGVPRLRLPSKSNISSAPRQRIQIGKRHAVLVAVRFAGRGCRSCGPRSAHWQPTR